MTFGGNRTEPAAKCCAVGLLFLVSGLSSFAHATSRPAPRPFIPNKALQKSDKVPPPSPVLEVANIYRGSGAIPVSDIHYHGGPGGDGGLTLTVSYPSHKGIRDTLGYSFHIVDGVPPATPLFPPGAYRPFENGRLSTHWGERRAWCQDEFSFRMYVTAVDSAGNESEPSNVVVVADDGRQGGEYEVRKRGYIQGYRNYMLDGTFEGEWAGHDEKGKDALLTFDRGCFQLQDASGTTRGFACAAKRDGSHLLDWIDFEVDTGEDFNKWRFGVFELHGNRLEMCLAAQMAPRPNSFLPSGGSQRYSLIRRKK